MLVVLWIRLLALAAACLFFAWPIYGAMPLLGGAFVVSAGVLSFWSLAVGLRPYLPKRDKYDLGELKRVHESEEVRDLLWNEAPVNPDYVLCTCCMEEYSRKFPRCPRCKTKPCCG